MDNKGNKQWVWLALDADTREIVGVYIGARDEAAARKLWESLPGVYPRVFGSHLHTATLDANARSHIRTFGQRMGRFCQANGTLAVGKETGKTSYVERFNNTLRQRVSRLVRKTLSLSKSLENHISAIWYFVHAYNVSLLL